jgi:superoxide dismutase, Fe-Mn family
MTMSRREVLRTASGTAALLSASTAIAVGPSKGTVPASPVPGKHQVVPLPFDPKKLKGLSERLLVSHHENNYAGAVKNLNKVEADLATVTKDTPGYAVAGLRERELLFTNSAILHEHYFGNLGGNGKAGGAIEKALASAFGGFGRWEELFRATAMSLAGGSGWAVLDLGLRAGDLRIYWSGNHTQAVAFGAPLLVLDMYEHAYHIDYGAAAAKYVDAVFANIDWEAVNRRHENAQRALTSLRRAGSPY